MQGEGNYMCEIINEKELMLTEAQSIVDRLYMHNSSSILSPYQIIPLWEEFDNYRPDVRKNDKRSVFLLARRRTHQDIRPAVIIVPGGAYEFLVLNREGMEIAEKAFEANSIPFVLYYRVSPNIYPAPQLDLLLAIKYVRLHAEQFGIDSNHIYLIGSSAGGHLCVSAAYMREILEPKLVEELKKSNHSAQMDFGKTSAKPNGICLNYPVISFTSDQHEESFLALTGNDKSLRKLLSAEYHIDRHFPKTYLWACADDSLVPVSNSLRMDRALQKAGVKHMTEIHPWGEHGVGIAKGTPAEGWIERMLTFMNKS